MKIDPRTLSDHSVQRTTEEKKNERCLWMKLGEMC